MPFSTLNRAQVKVPAQRAQAGIQKPHVELAIHWSLANVQRVMVLVDTGAECSLVYDKLEQFPHPRACIDGYGDQNGLRFRLCPLL